MKTIRPLLLFFLVCAFLNGFSQKNLSEGSLVYSMSVETGSAAPKMADMFDGATNTVYIKGKMSRIDLVSGLGSEATIFNAANDNGFILKDYSGQKLMITLTPEDWESNNGKYKGISFENTGETATISGYNCKKAVAKYKNGSAFTVYYTNDISLANKSYDPQFAGLPGLPVQYEMESGQMKFKFTLSSVNFDAVPASKFEAPKSGYRVMTYKETKSK